MGALGEKDGAGGGAQGVDAMEHDIEGELDAVGPRGAGERARGFFAAARAVLGARRVFFAGGWWCSLRPVPSHQRCVRNAGGETERLVSCAKGTS